MPETSPPILNLAVLALPFLMLGGLFVSNVAGEYYTNRARDHLFKHEMTDFVDDINKAGHVSNGLNYRSYILAVNVPLTILQVRMSDATTEEKRTLFEQANGYMDKVLSVNPRIEAAYFYKAKAQQLAGPDAVPDGLETPEQLYLKTLKMNSMHLGARLALLDLYKKENRSRRELIDLMEPGLSMFFINPIASQYYAKMAELYLENKDYVNAKKVMGQMVDFQRRSDLSRKRVNMSLPQALLRADPLQ